MVFGVDHFDWGAASCVFAGFALVMVIQSFRKAFGDAYIQRIVATFEDIYVPHRISIPYELRTWPFGGNFFPVKIPASRPVIKKARVVPLAFFITGEACKTRTGRGYRITYISFLHGVYYRNPFRYNGLFAIFLRF